MCSACVATGRRLGDFTLGPVIGEGSYGAVYRADQDGLDREAVVKVLHTRHHGNERVVQRFLREAKLASRLDHPYAAHVYAFGAETDGVLWIAMELVRGTTLATVRANQPGGQFTLAQLAPLLDGICEVVHTAHEQGIVHRDLKPDNIMVVSRAGRLLPKLLDLGIAKLGAVDGAIETSIDGDVNATGAIGSPHYMAPEQWSEDQQVDARADVYALGAVAFEMLVGRPPYTGTSRLELLRAHLAGKVPALPAQAAAVEPVIRRALCPRPDERYPTALAFAAAMRAAAGIQVRADALPRLADDVRALVTGLPQPIADAVAALEAAHNPHQARDCVWEIVHVTVRWLAVVAMAAHSRTGGALSPGVVATLRELPRRDFTDRDWLELARALTRPFHAIREAHPVPGLVEVLATEPCPIAPMIALHDSEDAVTSEAAVVDRLADMLALAAPMLRAVAVLSPYPLIVPIGTADDRSSRGETWMGVRRAVRPIVSIATGLATGQPVLVDLDGRPVLQLAPLCQISAPSPGAARELFVFAGPGRVRGLGARLAADPHGFERHDDAVWTWLRALLPDGLADADLRADESPYQGLAAFTELDAERYVGRERESSAMVNLLAVQPIVAVVGPSGAGKSSFVRAGVVPMLPPSWRSVVIRPGSEPVLTLAEREPGVTRVVIVDQLEELFTLCHDPDVRSRFAAQLASIARDPDQRVVLTIRDDFVTRASELPALRDELARAVMLLATPVPEDLRRVLEIPARRAGYDFDDGLVDDMVATVARQPGALAMLSFCAERLWELRDRHFRRLTRAAYIAIGGVDGALAQHAEDTLRGFTADDQRHVRNAFRHLVTSEGTRAVTTRHELAQILGAGVRVVDRLVDARLLVVSDDGVIEVIHEALLAAWPRLVGWRLDDAEGAQLRDQLRAAARQWHERARPRGLLWRDEALDDYTRWRARWPSPLPELDAAFADASVRYGKRRTRIRRGLAGAAAGVLTAGVVALAVINRIAERNASDAHAREIASYVEQGRTLLAGGDYRGALPLVERAHDLGDTSRAVDIMLHRARQLGDVPVLAIADTGVAAAFRTTGELVYVDIAGNAAIWDPDSRQVRAQFRAMPSTTPPRFVPAVSADGARVAIPGPDAVAIWNGAATSSIPVAGGEGVAFDPGGNRLAIATATHVIAWQLSPSRELWRRPSLLTGKLAWSGDAIVAVDAKMANARRIDATDTVELGACRRMATSMAGIVACLADGAVHVGDAVIPAPDVDRIALSPDGKIIALARTSGVVEIIDIATGTRRGLLPVRALQLAFTSTGAELVVSNPSSVAAWDLATQHEVVKYAAIGGSATVLAGAPYIAIDARDRRVALLGVADVRVVPLADPGARLVIDAGVALGHAHWLGDDIVSTSETGVEVWSGMTGARRAHVVAAVSDSAHASPDGTLVAIPIDHAPSVEIRELTTGALRTTLQSSSNVRTAVFDATGTRVVTGNERGDIEVFDLAGRVITTLRGHTGVVLHAELSRDGTRVVSASYDGTARVWDVATGRELGRVHVDDDVYDAALDASGTKLVVACHDRSVTVWDATTFMRLQTFALSTPAITAAFDETGELVAAGGEDGTVAVFAIASGREIVRYTHAAAVETVAFGPRGLLSTSFDHRAIVWDIDGTGAADVTASVTATRTIP